MAHKIAELTSRDIDNMFEEDAQVRPLIYLEDQRRTLDLNDPVDAADWEQISGQMIRDFDHDSPCTLAFRMSEV